MEFLFLIILVPLLLAEFGEVSPWAARRLIRWAVRRLGEPETVERFSEEWEAELNLIPGKLFKLGYALGRLLLLPLTLRELRASSLTRSNSIVVARTGRRRISAGEFLDIVRRHEARLSAYGIDHFQVRNQGESILVQFIDGSLADVGESKALEALLEDLCNYDQRNEPE